MYLTDICSGIVRGDMKDFGLFQVMHTLWTNAE